MGTLIILAIAIIATYFIFFKKSNAKGTSVSPSKTLIFDDGVIDNEVIQFADAFLVLSQQYPEDCRYTLSPNRATMHFYDFNCSTFFRAFINNDNPAEYMRWQDFLQGNHSREVGYLGLPLCTDCGWVLRHYGHSVGNSWDCELCKSVSKSTADKVYQLLKASSRLKVQRTDTAVFAEYNS